eukprot:scaffold105543_cov78-Phaeocystis_antarctica.AAC.3
MQFCCDEVKLSSSGLGSTAEPAPGTAASGWQPCTPSLASMAAPGWSEAVQCSRRLWAGTRAPPQPHLSIHTARAPVPGLQGGPEQDGGASRAATSRMGCC